MTYINFCYRLVCVQRSSQNLISILPWHLSSLYFTDGQNSPFLRLQELQRIMMYTRIKSKLSKQLPDRSGILRSPSTGWLFQSCLDAFVVGQRLLSLLQDWIYWWCQVFFALLELVHSWNILIKCELIYDLKGEKILHQWDQLRLHFFRISKYNNSEQWLDLIHDQPSWLLDWNIFGQGWTYLNKF